MVSAGEIIDCAMIVAAIIAEAHAGCVPGSGVGFFPGRCGMSSAVTQASGCVFWSADSSGGKCEAAIWHWPARIAHGTALHGIGVCDECDIVNSCCANLFPGTTPIALMIPGICPCPSWNGGN